MRAISRRLLLFLLAPAVLLPFQRWLATDLEATVTFTHGVASGDVTPSRATLWTRIAQEADLTLELAIDQTFQQPTFTQTAHVSAAADFTVKLAVPVQPGQTYFYRWRHGATQSDVGSFKTPPLPAVSAHVRFAFSGDSDGVKVNGVPFFNNFEAFDAVRAENVDFFVYLGDTVYADSAQRAASATTVDDYRALYKENRDFSALRSLLARTSVYAIWDDHEVRADFAGAAVDPLLYANGRAAFLEYLPIRPRRIPPDTTCAGAPFFRVFHWGTEVDVIILDERSCRSASAEIACGGDLAPTLPQFLRSQVGVQFGVPLPNLPSGCLETLLDPSRTLLGARQKRLFKGVLRHSRAKFKFVVTQEPMQQLYTLPYDRWEGYGAERTEILQFIRDRRINNVIFLTADLHASLINEVFLDRFTDAAPIAHEFVTGPIAAATYEQHIRSLAARLGTPPDTAVNAFQSLLDLVGVDCRHLNAFSYGLVEVDAATGTATFALKDDQGAVLRDQRQPAIFCAKTVGP